MTHAATHADMYQNLRRWEAADGKLYLHKPDGALARKRSW